MPNSSYLTDILDFQSSSSFRILKHTVPWTIQIQKIPDGYTFGWGNTGLN